MNMPNWTSNRIYIEGEPADIRAFLEAVKWVLISMGHRWSSGGAAEERHATRPPS